MAWHTIGVGFILTKYHIMAKIFKQQGEINEHPNRNNFDGYFQNHLTMKQGILYPFMCKPTIPGDSFRISVDYGLKFMPLAFPVQTRMRVIFHFFQVYNRNIWKNWTNFIQGLEEHTHPYIDQPNSFFATSSLSDYLGCPTSVVSDTPVRLLSRVLTYDVNVVRNSRRGGNGMRIVTTNPLDLKFAGTNMTAETMSYDNSQATPAIDSGTTSGQIDVDDVLSGDVEFEIQDPDGAYAPSAELMTEKNAFYLVRYDPSYSSLPVVTAFHSEDDFVTLYRAGYNGIGYIFRLDRPLSGNKLHSVALSASYLAPSSYVSSRPVQLWYRAAGTSNAWTFVEEYVGDTSGDMIIDYERINNSLSDNNAEFLVIWNDCFMSGETMESFNTLIAKTPELQSSYAPTFIGMADDFVVSTDIIPAAIKDLRINALPFRAYESIYNAFYRNTQNQPFILNGQPVYNRYNTSLEDGADTTPYHLFYRNWELDAFTSCMPSPQQGVAPLVGMTALGDIDITDDDGIRTFGRYEFDDDGKTFTGKISIHNPGESVENDRMLRTDALAKMGLSINDFRNVNALQHWLETNMRKGYKYRDFIAGHFGKGPSHAEMDMPEFIGGFTRPVDVNMISQTSRTDDTPLGAYAGQANAFSNGKGIPTINHYSDDYGYLIGICCVVPDPAYSQVLPKHFTYHDKLDYYFPEFAQLGMQPVPVKEVAPLQALLEDVSVNKTFGYNRPNYDLIANMDEVHGQFRTDLRTYLIQRLFAKVPELGNDFLVVKPEETENIFTYSAPNDDNIVGQIIVDMKMKRPMPRVHYPSLGK